MHVVRQTAFYCRTCKNYAKLWLMHARVFERESKTNNEHTVAVLCQRHDFILSHHLFVFVFLFFNQKLCISFCFSFYYCTWPKWLIYPTTTLIPGTTSIQEGRVYILKLFPLQKVLSPFLNNHEIRKKKLCTESDPKDVDVAYGNSFSADHLPSKKSRKSNRR